jgi:hypothetical protein
MLKKSFSTFVLIFFSLVLFGQGSVSLKAGYNNSTLNDKSDPDEYRYGRPEFESKPSFYISLSSTQSDRIFFHWEESIDFVVKNFSFKGTSGGLGSSTTIDCDYKLYYLNVHYLPVLEFGGNIALSVKAGPSIDYLFKSKRNGIKEYFYMNFNPPMPASNHLETTILNGSAQSDIHNCSLNFVANAKLTFKISQGIGFLLDFNYSKGLTNISMINDFRFTCNNFSIGAGISFKL